MLGLTMAWFLNVMGLDSLINMWSSTVLNFFFSLIAISMLRSTGLETVKYLCQGQNFGGWRCKVIDKSTLWDGVMYHVGEEYYLAIV